MIIDSSRVAMASSRTFIRRQSEEFSVTSEEATKPKFSNEGFLSMLEKLKISSGDEVDATYSPDSIKGAQDVSESLSPDDNAWVTFQTINYLLKILFFKQIGGESISMSDMMSNYQDMSPKTYNLNMNHTSTYYESESTSFATQGKVITKDGREIDFGIDVSMSRSFMAQNSESIKTNLKYTDPLVISLDSNPVGVSDMKFEFDLDADGELDEISYLNESSAFLALDKNGNGDIDDGSELFGAALGDGFMDLSQYDLDGNGWIDEADDIYDKLRIWQVKPDGTRQLYTLKEKDIGALYLGNVNSAFTLTDNNNNANAMIRKSGVYLTEEGLPRMMAHVDMVS